MNHTECNLDETLLLNLFPPWVSLALLLEEPPEPLSADLAPGAVKSSHRSLRMFRLRLPNFSLCYTWNVAAVVITSIISNPISNLPLPNMQCHTSWKALTQELLCIFDFSKGYPSLSHTPRTRIHPEEEDLLGAVNVPLAQVTQIIVRQSVRLCAILTEYHCTFWQTVRGVSRHSPPGCRHTLQACSWADGRGWWLT